MWKQLSRLFWQVSHPGLCASRGKGRRLLRYDANRHFFAYKVFKMLLFNHSPLAIRFGVQFQSVTVQGQPWTGEWIFVHFDLPQVSCQPGLCFSFHLPLQGVPTGGDCLMLASSENSHCLSRRSQCSLFPSLMVTVAVAKEKGMKGQRSSFETQWLLSCRSCCCCI